MTRSRALFGVAAVTLLILLSMRQVGAPPARPLPLALYGTGDELGGQFPLAEWTVGDASPIADEVARQIELRSEIVVSSSAGTVELDPRTTPVLLLTLAGSTRMSRANGEALREFLLDGGFVVCVPTAEAGAQVVRQWVRETFPNDPLMELPPDHIALTDDTLPGSLRSLSAGSVGVDALRLDGEIRLLLPRRVGGLRPTPGASSGVAFAASSSLLAALRSPYARRIATPPIDVQAERDGERVVVTASVLEAAPGDELRVAVFDVGGSEVSAKAIHGSRPGAELALTFSAEIAAVPFHPGEYWLRAEWRGDAGFRTTLSLSDLLSGVDTELRGQTTWQAGSPASVRVIVRQPGTDDPVEGAAIDAAVWAGESELAAQHTTSNSAGSADLRFELPEDFHGDAELRIQVRTPMGDDILTEVVSVELARKILLTTDKPLYQPGQQVHMRSLTLRKGDMRAVGGGTVVFEIEDSKPRFPR
jgi:hypothetical protein